MDSNNYYEIYLKPIAEAMIFQALCEMPEDPVLEINIV